MDVVRTNNTEQLLHQKFNALNVVLTEQIYAYCVYIKAIMIFCNEWIIFAQNYHSCNGSSIVHGTSEILTKEHLKKNMCSANILYFKVKSLRAALFRCRAAKSYAFNRRVRYIIIPTSHIYSWRT